QQTIEENRRVQYFNGRIDRVLSEVTGQETDGRAESWWQWWQEYNDLYVPDEKPVYKVENEIRVGTCECFLPGTSVWTETGPVPIERIRVGDRVLSQAPDTGELAYKLVLQTTIRPEAATVRVGMEGDEICATNGHPFWVAGRGWKMAKNLEPGMRLHTVSGSREITHIEEGPKSEAHNLLVADFQSFFVGNAKVLVHDNSIRQPTAAIVPGVTAE
ncbi:MAG: HINT domain-containing protein, partial [Planctomycetes bacterium]|nr:HINT domain-containing protein [Planctomycetota bacterium]